MDKPLFKIRVTSNGKFVGHIGCDEFRKAAQAPRTMFLPEVVSCFNAMKERTGEPERVEMVFA
jgi:hypothetical protein